MVENSIVKQISEFTWEIPRGAMPQMQVPVRIFATEEIIKHALTDISFQQAMNVACLPGVEEAVMVMPDVHQGYGFPIGAVAAMRLNDGVISPGGIGYDINCGVRLLSSQIPFKNAKDKLEKLSYLLDAAAPSGVGATSSFNLKRDDLEKICSQGVAWARGAGYATENDLRRIEEHGSLAGGSLSAVSSRAIERGMHQLGTLGSGNHFLEVDVVDEIFFPEAAAAYGLFEGCLVVQIHCGSRGFGHQICTDYVQEFQNSVRRYGIEVMDRELVCAPLDSKDANEYLQAMRAAANYAFVNRQILANGVRQAFEQCFSGSERGYLQQVYDVAHNIGKMETHIVHGIKKKLCVHRKGATRAFGPGHPDLPEEYSSVGQPVLIPGSMGTASWVLAGTQKSMEVSFGSACHGAGRLKSRAQAKRSVRGDQLVHDLAKQGIIVRAGSLSGVAEEAPNAYKDVDEVIEAVTGVGIARKVARLKPVVVVKG